MQHQIFWFAQVQKVMYSDSGFFFGNQHISGSIYERRRAYEIVYQVQASRV